MIEGALLGRDRRRFPGRGQLDLHQLVATLPPLACGRVRRRGVTSLFDCRASESTAANACVRALTHVVEVLPEGLHPAVRVLAALCGERVRDLLAAILVADADVLRFALGVFLRRSYPGLLPRRTPLIWSRRFFFFLYLHTRGNK